MKLRLTKRQRALLTLLAAGHSVLDEDYLSHVMPGAPSRVEGVLLRLEKRGLIDWSGPVSDVTITDAGRAALRGDNFEVVSTERLWYFGCGPRDSGHYWWSAGGDTVRGGPPNCPYAAAIDSGLCPARSEAEGVYRVSRCDNWVVIAWWDRSQDTRPGSNSAIVLALSGIGIDRVLEMARRDFPWVFSRMKFELRPEAGGGT